MTSAAAVGDAGREARRHCAEPSSSYRHIRDSRRKARTVRRFDCDRPPRPASDDSRIALELLQEKIEERIPYAVRPIATPPPWRPPWRHAAEGEPQQERGHSLPPVKFGDVAATSPLGDAGEPHGHRRPYLPELAYSKASPRNGQLMSQVLQQLIPLQQDQEGRCASTGSRSQDSPHGAAGEPSFACAEIVTDVASEIVAFRSTLSKSFGNLTRAFRAMKNAIRSQKTGGRLSCVSCAEFDPSACGLSCAEFEWCVSAYLHYGDRRLARRMFASLDSSERGSISLLELAQQPCRKGLFSLVEFRRLLLERHVSLANAFRELEEYLKTRRRDGPSPLAARPHSLVGRSGRSVNQPQFVEATAFFGLDAQQATHFFGVMDADGDGKLTLNEFLEALTQMPRQVLLHDLRQRLLSRYPSVPHAFQDLAAGGGHCRRFDPGSFTVAMSKVGIVDVESAEIFRIVDEDGSGDISLDEFREALRDMAPNISLECFWLRFAAEWPEVSVAARNGGDAARRSAGMLLLELLPQELQHAHAALPSPRLDKVGRAPASARLPKRASLSTVSPEVFDALAVLLDISRANALELFAQIKATVALRRRPAVSRQHRLVEEGNADADDSAVDTGPGIASDGEIHIEDFLEQLQLWAENPLSGRLSSQSGVAGGCNGSADVPAGALGSVVQQMVAPTRAAISALKAELAPPIPGASRPQEKLSSRASRGSSRRKIPKPPWQAFSSGRTSSLSARSA